MTNGNLVLSIAAAVWLSASSGVSLAAGPLASNCCWPLESTTSDEFMVQGHATEAEGVRGNSVRLDGDSLLTVNRSSALSESDAGFTFTVWVNPYTIGDRQQMIAAKNRYSLGERQWGVMIDRDGRFRLYVHQKAWATVDAKSQPVPGHWFLVGVVVKPGEAELWINGKQAGTVALSMPISKTDAPLTLGGVDDDGRIRQTLFGAIDEAQLFDRPLSKEEMASLYRPVTATHEVPKQLEPYPLWDIGEQLPLAADVPVLQGVAFSVIKPHEPETDGGNWLLGTALAWHKGRLYASYGFNTGGENTVGEQAHVRASDDGGKTWGPVEVIDAGEDDLGVSHGVFLSHAGQLWAFQGAFYDHLQRIHTRAYVLDESTGRWLSKGTVIENGFWPMQEPLKMDDGNWIMAGIRVDKGLPGANGNFPAVAISHGDDLTKWDMIVIPTAEGVTRVWGESTVIVDGARVLNISRWGGQANALVAVSTDYGRTWSPSHPSNLPMATSKPYAGTLSTGENYLICTTTADSGTRRSPLTIALSRPGEAVFSSVFVIRPAVFPDGPGPSEPGASLCYPYAVEHEDRLYVGYAVKNRRTAEMAVIPIDAIAATPEMARAALDGQADRTAIVFDGRSPNKLACDTTLRRMPDGSWVMIMLGGGDKEPLAENRIFLARSHDQGATWSPIEPLDFGFPREGRTVAMVPSELMVHDATCTLFVSTHDGRFGGWKAWMVASNDSCRTWGEPIPSPGRLHDRTFIRNHIVTRDGRILLPFQHYLDAPGCRNPRNGVIMSDDGGKTWSEYGNIRLSNDDGYTGWAENNIVELSDGRIAMIIRADRLGGVLYCAESLDGGRTWPEFAAKTDIPNPGSKATLYPLGGDAVALLHNPNPKGRYPLSLWISYDGLKTWPYRRVVVRDSCDGPGRALNYPDGFVSADKAWLHFAFDDNRHRAVYVGAKLPFPKTLPQR